MKLDNTSHPQLDPTNCMASSKAWWHGVRSNVVLSDMLEESTKNLLTSNYMGDGCGGKSGKSRAANHQFGEGTDAYKEMQFTALPQSGSCSAHETCPVEVLLKLAYLLCFMSIFDFNMLFIR